MRIYFVAVFLLFMLVLTTFTDAKCPINEHMITRKCCDKSCQLANLPKDKRCKWPCAKVEPQCHCNRKFFRHSNGKCVLKNEC